MLLTEQSQERAAGPRARTERARRLLALQQVELLRPLDDDGPRRCWPDHLRHAPFARGEVLTRQGEPGDWLFLVTAGEVAVRVATDGGLEREVAQPAARAISSARCR